MKIVITTDQIKEIIISYIIDSGMVDKSKFEINSNSVKINIVNKGGLYEDPDYCLENIEITPTKLNTNQKKNTTRHQHHHKE